MRKRIFAGMLAFCIAFGACAREGDFLRAGSLDRMTVSAAAAEAQDADSGNQNPEGKQENEQTRQKDQSTGEVSESNSAEAEEEKRAAEEAAKKAAEEAEKKAAEKAAKEAEQKAAEEAAKEAAQKAAQEAAEEAARKAAEKAAEETAQKAAEKAAEETAQKAAEKAAQEAAQKDDKEADEEAEQKAAEKATEEGIPHAAEETDKEASAQMTDNEAANTKKPAAAEAGGKSSGEERKAEEKAEEKAEDPGILTVLPQDGTWSVKIHDLSDAARIRAEKKETKDRCCSDALQLLGTDPEEYVIKGSYQITLEEGGIISEIGCRIELEDPDLSVSKETRLYLICGEDEKKSKQLDFEKLGNTVSFTSRKLGLFLFAESAGNGVPGSKETPGERLPAEAKAESTQLAEIEIEEARTEEPAPESIESDGAEARESETEEPGTEGAETLEPGTEELETEEPGTEDLEFEEPETEETETESIEAEAIELSETGEEELRQVDPVVVGIKMLAAAPASQQAEVTSGKKIYVPDKWRIRDGSPYGYAIKFSSEINGSKKTAYCFEPSKGGGDDGTYKATALAAKGELSAGEANRIKKALFYLYGGPGWDLAGVKNALKSCSSADDYYVASHYILAKMYCSAIGEKWNVVISGGGSYTALNSTGTSEVNAAIDKINAMAQPSASLSATTVKGNLKADGTAVSDSITYNSTVPGNQLTFTVPSAVTAVVAGKEYPSGSTAAIKPGQSFYFKKKGYGQAHNQTITLKADIFTDYEGYIIYMKNNYQSKGFAFVASKNFSVTVRWPDLEGELQLKKTCADPLVSQAYDFTGTEYTVFESDGTTVYKVLNLNADGTASLTGMPLGTYLVRETKQPDNLAYQLDPQTYEVKIPGDTGVKASLQVSEEPFRTALKVVKKVQGQDASGSGQADQGPEDMPASGRTDQDQAGDLQPAISGIRFVLTHADGAMQQKEGRTDENGELEFGGLPVGTYTLTEDADTVPDGYKTADPITIVISGTSEEGSIPTIECSAIDEKGNIVVYNQPQEQTGSVTFTVLKRLDKGKLKGGQFRFNLCSLDGKILQTKENAEDGEVRFDPVFYDNSDIGKEYVYRIQEVIEDQEGVTYDTKTIYEKVQIAFGRTQEDQLDITHTTWADEALTQELTQPASFTNSTRPVVRIIKVKGNGEEGMLEGARFCLMDQEERVLEEWTSDGKEAYTVKTPLEFETTYILRELEAPAGYSRMEDIVFETLDDITEQVITARNKRQYLVPTGVNLGSSPLMWSVLMCAGLLLLLGGHAGRKRREKTQV